MPSDSARKVIATVHANGTEIVLIAKGAPDVLLQHCTHVATTGDRPVALDHQERQAVRDAVDGLVVQGLRVLALARRELVARPVAGADAPVEHIHGSTFLGVVGLPDLRARRRVTPSRPAAAPAWRSK